MSRRMRLRRLPVGQRLRASAITVVPVPAVAAVRAALGAALDVALGLALGVALLSPTTALDAQPRSGRPAFTLSTPDFADGGMIPARHAQQGRDRSPTLRWSGAPDSTRSFVLIVHDVDAAIGDGTDDLLHWMVWNIPGSARELPGGMPSGAQRPDRMRQISASGPYYRGPAAASDGPAHHYLFELYALDATINVAATGLSPAATRAAVMQAMRSHIQGKAVLTGRYKRPAP